MSIMVLIESQKEYSEFVILKWEEGILHLTQCREAHVWMDGKCSEDQSERRLYVKEATRWSDNQSVSSLS
jgi:hypothetical protein